MFEPRTESEIREGHRRRRAWFLNPPSAVRDDGIDLLQRRPVVPVVPKPVIKPEEPLVAVEPAPVVTIPDEAQLDGPPPSETPLRYPGIRLIQSKVAKRYGKTVVDLLSRRRTMDIVRPRQIMYWIIKTMTLHSYPEIGRRCGGKDPTSVLHGVRKIDDLRAIDPDLQTDIDELMTAIRAEM